MSGDRFCRFRIGAAHAGALQISVVQVDCFAHAMICRAVYLHSHINEPLESAGKLDAVGVEYREVVQTCGVWRGWGRARLSHVFNPIWW